MPRTKEYGEIKRAETREKILSSAVSLFAKKGLAATSAVDIAQNAGVSVGLMYHYYKTKEEVFGTLIKLALKDIAELKKMLSDSDCPKKALENLSTEIIAEFEAGYEFSEWMMLLLQPPLSKGESEWASGIIAFHTEFIDEIAVLISKGQREKLFCYGNAVGLAQIFMANFKGLCLLQLMLKEEFIVPNPEALTAYLRRED
ncbi:MAG: TetR/AcrR family transcriptional regulator [Firmicutes bacterium]|nr:TetR/AcrR family transcriptional regulator [Bacillota bacterium]